jgi:hypothetical protein
MTTGGNADVAIRPYSAGDLWLLERLTRRQERDER